MTTEASTKLASQAPNNMKACRHSAAFSHALMAASHVMTSPSRSLSSNSFSRIKASQEKIIKSLPYWRYRMNLMCLFLESASLKTFPKFQVIRVGNWSQPWTIAFLSHMRCSWHWNLGQSAETTFFLRAKPMRTKTNEKRGTYKANKQEINKTPWVKRSTSTRLLTTFKRKVFQSGATLRRCHASCQCPRATVQVAFKEGTEKSWSKRWSALSHWASKWTNDKNDKLLRILETYSLY